MPPMSKKRSACQSACFHPSLTTSANFRDFRDVTIFQFEIAKFDLKTLKYYNLTRYIYIYMYIYIYICIYIYIYVYIWKMVKYRLLSKRRQQLTSTHILCGPLWRRLKQDRFISKMFLRGDSVILVLRNPKHLGGTFPRWNFEKW